MNPTTKFSNADLTRWKREINPAPIIANRIKIQRVNNEWLGCCPNIFHKTKLGKSDTHPSFTIYKLDDGTWGYKCFSCGAKGNVFQFVQHVDDISFPKAVARVLEEAGVEGWQDGAEQGISLAAEAETPKKRVTFPLSQYQPAIEALEHALEGQAWLHKRGITMDIARKFKLGFVQSAEKITSHNAWLTDGWISFPTLSADGKTVTAVKYRSLVYKKAMIDGKENSGILRAPNTSTTLFNLQTVKPGDDVWIVEGEPDTLVLAQAGLMAVGYPGASYTPSDDECELLSSAKRKFLAGDIDAPGTKTMAALQKRLHGETYIIKWPNKRKDANDVLTKECGNDATKFKALVEDLKSRATQTEAITNIRTASDITPLQVKWLWPDKIPFGMLTLFAGDPDNGKSMAGASVAAICSTGGAFPETHVSRPPADVLMLIGEDDPEHTAVPRLIAAQADLKRIHFLESVRPVSQENRAVRLDFDIPAIEKQLAANPNIRLVIIDPISNYLGKVSMVAEQEVRSILTPLSRAIEKFGVALIIVMHLNKKGDLDAIARVGGAMAFIGVSRCAWLFVRDVKEETPESEDVTLETTKKPDTFSMRRMKNNLAPSYRTGLSYTIATRPVPIEGEQVFIPYVKWGTAFDGSANEALASRRNQPKAEPPPRSGRPNIKQQKAIEWLENILQDGEPHDNMEVRKAIKKGCNLSFETIERAYEEMVRERQAKKAWPVGKKYFWQLEPMNAIGAAVIPQESDLTSVESAS